MTDTTDTQSGGSAHERSRPTLLAHAFGGDWRTSLYVAVPTVLVAFALGLLTSTVLFWLGSGDSTDPSGFGHSRAGFLHASIGNVAMAFGSPLFVHGSSGGEGATYGAGVAPLTVSLLVLGVFAALLRTYLPAAGSGFRTPAALRAAAVTAVGLTLLSLGANSTREIDGDTVRLAVTPGRVLGWSLLVFVVVALATATATGWHRLARDWRLPVQGAIAALGTGIVLAWLSALGVTLAEAHGDQLDVLKAMPVLLAYLVNIGLDVFHGSMGAALHASLSGPDGSGGSISLFDRHGASAWYFLLLLIPTVSIAVGVAWMHRARREVSVEHLARSCYRMALPAVLLYLALAVPSRLGFSFSGTGEPDVTAHAGPQIPYGALILLGWFVVLGFVASRLVLARAPQTAADGPAPPTARRARSARWRPTAEVVGLLATSVAVAVTGGGVATASEKPQAGDFGAVSLLVFGPTVTLESSATADAGGGTVEVQPVPTPSFADTRTAADVALHIYAFGEQGYFDTHGTYTSDAGRLNVRGAPDDPRVQIVRADARGFCLESVGSDGRVFSYDSNDGFVVSGRKC